VEFKRIIFKRYIFAVGLSSSPSIFLEQLDFIDSPNLRIQVFKFNLYLYIDIAERFIKRNKDRISFAQDSYNKGYLQCGLDISKIVGMPFGRA
jgi:hypothetical protein